MDEFFGGMDGRLRVSITDSTMMWIVHYAMDKAHEKVKSKEGDIERLNEISKFYELAVMQLDGCMKFVQEEIDNYYILESRHEEVLADLSEIRDRLQCRLNESELAIREKDRELKERLENELKLRQALEIKERELDSMRAKNKLGRSRSEGVDQEHVIGNWASADENKEGEFCELKNSVDQQVWNIRQKLEPDNKFDKEKDQEKKIEQMGSDIDVLKETLDVAFVKMQNAIISSEVAPIEHQWIWSIEKDTIAIMLKGMIDFQEDFEAKVSNQEKQVPIGLAEFWSDLINEVKGLRNELEPLVQQEEVQVQSVDSSQTDLGCKIPNKTSEKQLSEDCSHSKSRKSSNGEELNVEKLVEEVSEENGSHHVAKMIKKHQSIIRKKSAEAEELNWLKREKMSHFKKRKGNSHKEETILEQTFLNFDAADKEKLGIQSWRNVWENINKVPCAENEELPIKMGLLMQELEEINWKTMMIEETYLILFEGLLNEFYSELYNSDLQNLIRESICKDFLTEVVKQWHENTERKNDESQTREEIYSIVLSELIKDCSSSYDFILAECQGVKAENKDIGRKNVEAQTREDISCIVCSEVIKDCSSSYDLILAECQGAKAESDHFKDLYTIESSVREDMHAILFREIFKRFNGSMESYIVKEEICQIVFDEIIKSIVNTNSSVLVDNQVVKRPDNFDGGFPFASEFSQSTESSVKEDVYMTAKNASGFPREAESEGKDKLLEGMLFTNKLHKLEQVSPDEHLTQKLVSIFNCLTMEEDLVLNAHYEIKEYNTKIDQVGLECEVLDVCQILKNKSTSTSVSTKLEMALQQLVKSKKIVGELASSLGIVVSDPDEVHTHSTLVMDVVEDREPSFCPQEENAKEQLNLFGSSTPILGFSQALVDFEVTVTEKLEINILRLEEIEHHLKPMIELVSTLRKKESLYRQAFMTRCQNLKKAELEVDLLGDQVDMLLGLLEKIYNTLHRYSPVLQQYFEVSDVIELMKVELNGVAFAHKH
nr:LOW QUALITY PROTEIN: repetitive organellar protein [Ziziphus jujuba var. spinosa]